MVSCRFDLTDIRGCVGVIVAALGCATVVSAQTLSGADSTMGRDSSASAHSASRPWVTREDGIRLGIATAATLGLAPLDRPISGEFAEPHWKQSRPVHHIARDIAFLGGDGPFVASAVVAAVGTTVGPRGLQRFAIHNMEAIALATVVNGVVKGVAGRALPGVQTKHPFQVGRGFHDRNGPFVSFPSGHTASAFAMAATIRGELQRTDSARGSLWGDIALGSAAAVGLARVVQRVHWPSDLPIAAVIGMWSGRVVQEHSRQSGRAAMVLRGLVVGRDSHGYRLGWSLRAVDLERTD
jgi:membrane-associated phospholipid phosphatase